MSHFQRTILDSPDCCNNCFGLRRRRDALGDPFRNPKQTTVEHAPADRVSQQSGVFCTCGVESSFDRIWLDDDCDDDRFRHLLKRCLRTTETLFGTGNVDRRSVIETALREWKLDRSVNDALEAGLSAGIEATTGDSAIAVSG